MVVIRAEDGRPGQHIQRYLQELYHAWGRTAAMVCCPVVRVCKPPSCLMGMSSYTEDFVRTSNNLIGLTAPSAMICPLVLIPLSGVVSHLL